MRTVLINKSGKMFQAVSGEKKSMGKTIGEAIDALTLQIPTANKETLYVVQRFQPDEFFTADQQNRLSELMEKLRHAEAINQPMNSAERKELEELIDAELEGSANRAEAMFKLVNE